MHISAWPVPLTANASCLRPDSGPGRGRRLTINRRRYECRPRTETSRRVHPAPILESARWQKCHPSAKAVETCQVLNDIL
jgi:hypothetical protein